MLTKEQIKNLKRGDEICMKVLFDSLCVDRIQFKTPDFPNDYFLPPAEPKYDPCRKFRKGDIVRLREYNGRKPYDYRHKQVIKNFGAKLDTVLEDELDSGNVDIFQDAPIDELTVRVNSCHLELVTPVEELEPYFVLDSPNTYNVCKRGETGFAATFYKKHALAKQRAEDYCAELNGEHRKEPR